MESSVLPVSLNDKVLSQCQLGDTEISILSTPGGFCLKWVESTKEKDGKPVRPFTHFSNEIESCGQLYPILLNEELELAVFGNDFKCNSEERKSFGAALVVCDNGTVLAAHRKWSKVLPTLFRHTERTVWAGVITDSNKSAIAVVSKGGIIFVALPATSLRPLAGNVMKQGTARNLSWQKEILTMTPLVCLGQNNFIFISDGYTSWLSILKFTSGDIVEHKCLKLSYCGIIRVTAVDMNNLNLFTCDGRSYKCEWKHLSEEIKQDQNISKPQEKKPSCTIEEAMTGIQNCSELMQSEGKCVQDLDTYLKQFTLATSLLVESQKEIFTAKVKVSQRPDESNSYIALISLTKKSAALDLGGRWWQLNITIPGHNGKQRASFRIDDLQFTKDICVSVPLPDIHINHSALYLKIGCYLVLQHYATLHPIFYILVCYANVNVLHFLTSRHILNSPSTCSADFKSAVQRMALRKMPNGIAEKVEFVPLPSCEVLLSFVSKETNVQLFLEMLNVNCISPIANVRDVNNWQLQLWYQDVPINIQYLQLDEMVLVTINGQNPSLVLSAKVALERHIVENMLDSSRVLVDVKAFRQAQQLCQILEFESTKATTVNAIGYLHHATTKMLSHLPL